MHCCFLKQCLRVYLMLPFKLLLLYFLWYIYIYFYFCSSIYYRLLVFNVHSRDPAFSAFMVFLLVITKSCSYHWGWWWWPWRTVRGNDKAIGGGRDTMPLQKEWTYAGTDGVAVVPTGAARPHTRHFITSTKVNTFLLLFFLPLAALTLFISHAISFFQCALPTSWRII